jgi:RNA polymerase sigma-70 factor (ECF subfamily)
MTFDFEAAALDALGRLAKERRGELTALARREGLGPEDAVDCVHDVFCDFLEAGLRGERPADPSALLRGMVVNAARNRRRRHHLAREHRGLDSTATADVSSSAEHLVARAQDCARLHGCVNQLCHSQRTVVMMRLLDEQPGEDVASALGLTRGHVDVLLHRAKASLRACMLTHA